MDKKNTAIGLILLGLAFLTMFMTARRAPAPQAPAAPAVTPAATQPTAAVAAPAANSGAAPAPALTASNAAFAATAQDDTRASVVFLENSFIRAHLTNMGGAVLNIELKKYPAEKTTPDIPYVINRQHVTPALAITEFPGLDSATAYEVVTANDREVVFRRRLGDQLEVVRRYILPPEGTTGTDPYRIRHETTFRNLTGQPVPLPRISLSVGTAAPLNDRDLGLYLTTAYNASGEIDFNRRGDLEGGGFLSMFGFGSRSPIPAIENRGPLSWTAVNNQFFTSILSPDAGTTIGGLTTRRVKLNPALPDTDRTAYGIEGIARFDLPAVAAQGVTALTAEFYTGPKEYPRLAKANVFKADENKVMQFGFFKWFAQILLWLMTWMHMLVPNWGVAIVLTTLSLKLVFLYPTLSASRSAKRMSKLQPEFMALREKHKDNPRKMQEETMALYKKHGVNPIGGCLPILVTMPFFIGFFSMLQSAAELRFAEFLWAKDLSAPDTVATILGFPINIMPVLMGATMIIQMRLTPMPTADKMQATMFKIMPWIFMVFCYNFSCALSLYSFVNGLFTIGQQLIVNRMKDPIDTVATARPAAPGGRSVKNVTPKRK